MSTEPGARAEVSVIVASVESMRSIERCLGAMRASLEGLRSELLVVDASRDGSADIAERQLGSASVLRCSPGTLTPALWATGIARSTGRVVALTTGHFVVEPGWARQLSAALEHDNVGVAGRVDLDDESSVIDWAVFFLRYSEFLIGPERPRRGVAGIPADNAAYDGEAIRRFVKTTGDGFWEVEFHRQLHAAGGSLAIVSGALARYARSFPFRTILTHRFHHGRHAGAWRVATGQRTSWTVLAASPLVPAALAWRVWRRVRSVPKRRTRFLRSLPIFLPLAAAWAAGEALGAITRVAVTRRPDPVPA